ncbi:cytochrome b561 domain-containing protein At4g18260-like [Apium graveolens]|uniref:cytochrome b561 domain-containing protein At4g18260-like n=1 Tax=Apium graveolens TaxID=4045 RepID=UPI003D79D24E
MTQVKKVVHLAILITSVVLTLPSFTRANDQEHVKSTDKLSSQMLFDIQVHGLLLWSSMGFLMPVAILAIRMSNREASGRKSKFLFYMHATLQILSVFVVTAGAVLSIRKFENTFNNTHQKMGLGLYGVIWLQALTGFFRPQRGNKGRSVWYLVHWILGTTVSLLGIVNIYTGLQAYHKKSSKSIRLWTTIFTAEVFFIAFLYLFQDKWNYIKKQGVILGDAPIQPTDQEMNAIPVPIEEKKISFSRGTLRKLMLYSQ